MGGAVSGYDNGTKESVEIINEMRGINNRKHILPVNIRMMIFCAVFILCFLFTVFFFTSMIALG